MAAKILAGTRSTLFGGKSRIIRIFDSNHCQMNRLFLLLFGMVALVAHAQVPDYVPTDGNLIWCTFDSSYVNAVNDEVPWLPMGSPIFVEGRTDSTLAISFDQSETYLKSNVDWFPGFSDHTISVWFKTQDAANLNQTIYNTSPHSIEAVGINPWQSGSSGTIGACLGPGEPYLWDFCEPFSNVTAELDSWTHFVAVKQGVDLRLYLNGTQVFVANGESYSADYCGLYLGESSHTTGFTDHEFIGAFDDFGLWNHALTESEIFTLYLGAEAIFDCTDPTACNFDTEATSDDGSCIPSGCMEPLACNYNALAECEGEACDYTCCPGPGCCLEGTVWDAELGGCIPIEATCPEDLDFDGVVGVNDLMELLSAFGTDCPEPEEPETTEFTCAAAKSI